MKLVICVQGRDAHGYVLSYFINATFGLKEKSHFRYMNVKTDSLPEHLFLWK